MELTGDSSGVGEERFTKRKPQQRREGTCGCRSICEMKTQEPADAPELEDMQVLMPFRSDRRICGLHPSALHKVLNWLTFDWILHLPLHYSALFDKFIKHQKSRLCSFSKGIIGISLHN